MAYKFIENSSLFSWSLLFFLIISLFLIRFKWHRFVIQTVSSHGNGSLRGSQTALGNMNRQNSLWNECFVLYSIFYRVMQSWNYLRKIIFYFFKFIWYFKPLKTDLFISFYVFFMIIYRQSESLKVNICSQITCQFA